jgi:hypothetical protein
MRREARAGDSFRNIQSVYPATFQYRLATRLLEDTEGYQVREGRAAHNALFAAEKRDIGPQNAYFWDINAE